MQKKAGRYPEKPEKAIIIRIGIAAGGVWHLLEREERLTLPELNAKVAEDLAEDRDVVCMGVGWLLRKGYIVLKKENSNYVVRLRKKVPK